MAKLKPAIFYPESPLLDVHTFSALALGLGPDWKRKQAIADVRMGELLKGSTVQQRLEFDNVVPMRRTGTEWGA